MTATIHRSRFRSTRFVALITSVLLVVAGVSNATIAANAAGGATIVPSITAASTSGLTLQVDVSGVVVPENKTGVYIALTESGTASPIGDGQWIMPHQMPSGAGSGSYSVPASALDRTKHYDALVWFAHGNPTPDAIVGQTPVTITEGQWDAVFPPVVTPPEATTLTLSSSSASAKVGESVTLAAQVSPAAAGEVSYFDGSILIGTAAVSGSRASFTTNAFTVGSHSISAKFTPVDPTAFDPSTAPAVVVTITGSTGPTTPSATGSFEWGVKSTFVNYIENLAGDGRVSVTAPTQRTGPLFSFPQSSAGDWNTEAQTGSVQFAGAVAFTAHKGALAFALANPKIVVTSASEGQLIVSSGGSQVMLAQLDLSGGTFSTLPDDGGVRWSGVPASLTPAGVPVFQQYAAGTALDPVTFTIASSADVEPVKPPVVKPTKPKPQKPSKPSTASTSRTAGSLVWGISAGFADYTTGNIAKGTVSTSGVGRSAGNFVFPQATGGDWNAKAQTGTVSYSGVVTFSGHHGLMSESFANPVITVTSASSGSISAGGRTFGLRLGSATKTVGSGGAVTWSNVSVNGAITGGGTSGGGSGGGSFGIDPLTFTVGAVGANIFGSSATSHPSVTNEPAAAAPTTTGVTVTTPADQIVAGGEIEIEAAGFEAGERDILVVLYSEPLVLDRNAGADAAGVVRWIGTLPTDLDGEHTITLQGSTDAGQVIDILSQDEYAAQQEMISVETGGDVTVEAQSAGPVPAGSATSWELWIGAVALIVVAGGMTGLVIAQRRRQSA